MDFGPTLDSYRFITVSLPFKDKSAEGGFSYKC